MTRNKVPKVHDFLPPPLPNSDATFGLNDSGAGSPVAPCELLRIPVLGT